MEMDLEDLEAAQAVQSEASEEDAADSPAMAQISEDMSESSASLKESLVDIGNQVERLATLTNDLVYLSRMEEADTSLAMTEIPVSDIVSETGSLSDGRDKLIDWVSWFSNPQFSPLPNASASPSAGKSFIASFFNTMMTS